MGLGSLDFVDLCKKVKKESFDGPKGPVVLGYFWTLLGIEGKGDNNVKVKEGKGRGGNPLTVCSRFFGPDSWTVFFHVPTTFIAFPRVATSSHAFFGVTSLLFCAAGFLLRRKVFPPVEWNKKGPKNEFYFSLYSLYMPAGSQTTFHTLTKMVQNRYLSS